MTNPSKRKTSEGVGSGISSTLFEWLRQHNVERIVKFIVIDDGDPAHCNDAIKRALRPFKFEVWDWKRIDLCTDVIADSSSFIRKVSLYCEQ